MTDSTFGPRGGGGPAPVSAGACPCVADLIQFGLGKLTGDESKRIEAHQAVCNRCSAWIAKAVEHRPAPAAPPPSAYMMQAAPAAAPRLRSAAPAIETVNPNWQRQALDELEKRLRLLDEQR